MENPTTDNRIGVGDDDPEDEEFYVMYKDRNEWADIEPVEQDDGPDAVVQIDYSPKFEDVYNYFRGVVEKGEKTERVLALTADAITLNAANYTVWQYRRDVLEALGTPCLMKKDGFSEDFETEFEFSRLMIEDNQKNYQVWHHRKILVSWASGYDENTGSIVLECEESGCNKLIQQELELTRKILRKDSKNYHAWQHRQWVLLTFGNFLDELPYIDTLIQIDVRNNSAWNQRYFVIANSPLSKETLDTEVEYTWSKISLAWQNESPWNYLRGVFRLYKKLDDPSLITNIRMDVQDRCLKAYATGIKRPPMLGFALELIEIHLGSDAGSKILYSQALEICDVLIEADSIRQNYWTNLKKELVDLYDEKFGSENEKSSQ